MPTRFANVLDYARPRADRAISDEQAARLLTSVAPLLSPRGTAALRRIAVRAGVAPAAPRGHVAPAGRSVDVFLVALRHLRGKAVGQRGQACDADAGTRQLHDADGQVVVRELRKVDQATTKAAVVTP